MIDMIHDLSIDVSVLRVSQEFIHLVETLLRVDVWSSVLFLKQFLRKQEQPKLSFIFLISYFHSPWPADPLVWYGCSVRLFIYFLLFCIVFLINLMPWVKGVTPG